MSLPTTHLAWKKNFKLSETGKVKVTSSGNVYDFTYFTDRDTTYKNFQAVNVTAGLLWDIWRKDEKLVTFGAVFDSPYTADLDQVRDFMEVIDVEGIIAVNKLHDRHHFEVDYPMSFGAGFGYHYSDALSFSMNITRTDWSEYMQEDENGVETRPIQGAPEERDIDDTYAVRCGTEYLIIGKKVIVPVRGGLFLTRYQTSETRRMYMVSASGAA